MVKVAIAGGSGNIGANIVDAILAAGKHTPIILSRSSKTIESKAEVRVVDYSNHASLVSALEGIHTVIVTLFTANAKEAVGSQLALLKAAKEVGVNRFAPSEWAARVNTTFYVYPPKIEVWDAVKKSGLETTRFIPGIYINMFAGGSNLPTEREAVAHFEPGKLLLDARAGTVYIPGDGTEKVTFTSAQDTGKFVAASLDLDKWEDVSGIVGETTTWNEVIDVAEKITGKKFQRTYLKEGDSETAKKLLESDFYSSLTKSVIAGHWVVEPTLNNRLPHLRPLTVEQYLRKYWEGADWSGPATAV